MHGMLAPNDFNSGSINAALFVGERFGKVYGSALERPTVTDVRLRLEAVEQKRTAVLSSARASRTEVRPGETLELDAVLRPYAQVERVVHLTAKLPSTLAPGPIRLLVSDGGTLDRLGGPAPLPGAQHAAPLADVVRQINQQHANDRVYVTVLDHAAQAVLDGGALEAVPLSMANVLAPLKDAQKMRLSGESLREAASAGVDFAVTGQQVVDLVVK
jgi:hypothetical protein